MLMCSHTINFKKKHHFLQKWDTLARSVKSQEAHNAMQLKGSREKKTVRQETKTLMTRANKSVEIMEMNVEPY